MSESAFSHFFRKKTNYTFIDYITNLRITKACQLLSDTTYTVAEICYTCGFNNLSNFIRTFKKKKAMTPNEYLRLFAKNAHQVLAFIRKNNSFIQYLHVCRKKVFCFAYY